MAASKPHIGRELLGRAHSPETTEQLFTERIKQKPLYLRPTSPTPEDKRSRRRLQRLRKKEYYLRKQKPKPLSAREKRESGLYTLPKEECKYAVFKELNQMWVAYMQDILDLGAGRRPQHAGSGNGALITAQSHGSKLVSADFHGAEVEVVRSRCAGRVGLKGIVVRDTKFTLMIVTEKDEVKTIPKEQTIFRFYIPLPKSQDTEGNNNSGDDGNDDTNSEKLTFELHGSQFRHRPVDRANKKFKWRNVYYL
ncbi:hypothetical protein P175DRAFT_0472623 [Aspergillus ochraceoroseus IBT 24754]|uniref:Ribonuclease P protein subunit n=2 Tax=Aspergillus ochraceoroseus TaxID=138278 RepID=A0A2T5MA13_9EURO|nr:uncharacterized protein P175DRAFT_0472623 [Aspergillus ochraceoroseus IBT 24754]KKK13042.1 putative ribonuclease P complex subunit Pop4 [Aspergillus ochraceoroseus]PTU25379.1 hypothetical protein P175DRAFT_0472623 [Aspergillus ochraceoroseus IBT 24754]